MDAIQSGVMLESQEIATRFHRSIEARRQALRQQTGERLLSVNPPPAAPKVLATRIARHNAAVAEWEAAWVALADDAAGLVPLVGAPDMPGAALAEKAAALRVRRYDIARRLVTLIADRSQILEAIRAHLAPLIEAAAADLAAVTETATKTLKDAKWLGMAARVRPGMFPALEARQLVAAAQQTEPVIKAAAVLADLRAIDAQAGQIANSQGWDQDAARAEVLAAWRVLTAGI